jgi:hypothetical protein
VQFLGDQLRDVHIKPTSSPFSLAYSMKLNCIDNQFVRLIAWFRSPFKNVNGLAAPISALRTGKREQQHRNGFPHGFLLQSGLVVSS